MAKQRSPVEQTSFVKGLITEANPLAFPLDASLDENNFVIKRDGTRRRRLGMDYENSYTIHNTTVTPPSDNKTVFSSFTWENAGGDPTLHIGVVQSGSVLKFFNLATNPVSGNLLYTYDTGVSHNTFISAATVDGFFVVATGEKNILIFSYTSGVISASTSYLTVRDTFGVGDTAASGTVDITKGSGLQYRPTVLTQAHRYNLRNQSFGIPRATKSFDFQVDTISEYVAYNLVYPSNSDYVPYALYPDVSKTSNPTIDRFHAVDLFNSPPGSFPAAKGYFIIDAMERGASRVAEYSTLLATYPFLNYPLISLHTDATPGGASVLEEFAGRIWYGGFSGEVTDPETTTPYLSSYIFFSVLVNDLTDITRCHQEGDPTSKETSDLVATDGGFLRLSGAYGIVGMKALGKSLIVLANNGVWRVTGGDSGFTATEYTVEKITDNGCSSPNSVIEVEGGLLYWSDDGIYTIGTNEFGDYVATNITQPTIQTLYDDISSLDKLYCFGFYDSYERKARWLYKNQLGSAAPVEELVLDINLNAFYPASLPSITSGRPKPVCMLRVPPFKLGEKTDLIEASGVQVVVGVDDVIVTAPSLEEGVREILYVTLVADSGTGTLQYTFSQYLNTDFVDWKTFNGTGIDAPAYLLTGYLTGGDSQRKKNVSYLTMHCERTEDGFEDDGSGNLIPTHPSSCKIQTQWEWTNSANSNRWGREFQAYRYNRLYLPANVNDPYDTGHSIITTKNKLRGKGRALSFLISTEPLKDCRILGWSMIVGAEANV